MMAKTNPNRKRSQVRAYRRKKELCEECGRFEERSAHECKENYVKADMTEQTLLKKDIVETRIIGEPITQEEAEEMVTNGSLVVDEESIMEVTDVASEDPAEDIDDIENLVEEESEDEEQLEEYVETADRALPELDARMKTILSYRKRKGLCAYCGTDNHNGDCEEDYTASDLRSDEEKENDPRTIITPKEQNSTVLEDIETDEINTDFINSIDDPFYKMEETVKIHTQRPYFMIDITQSDNDQKITFEYINYIARKYNTMIIFLIGDPSAVFTFVENRQLEGLRNVSLMTNTLDQNIVNYMYSAKRFFGFPSRYITYCMCYGLKCTTFMDDTKEEFDVPCDIVTLKEDENVTIETIKRNVLSWRL
jgi:hypothetical protein